jgi:hypothetical protein
MTPKPPVQETFSLAALDELPAVAGALTVPASVAVSRQSAVV